MKWDTQPPQKKDRWKDKGKPIPKPQPPKPPQQGN